jgi:hypothetical protein
MAVALLGLLVLLLGFACGYAFREYISRRRRALDRRKFERGWCRFRREARARERHRHYSGGWSESA